jgi:hypothetical protein
VSFHSPEKKFLPLYLKWFFFATGKKPSAGEGNRRWIYGKGRSQRCFLMLTKFASENPRRLDWAKRGARKCRSLHRFGLAFDFTGRLWKNRLSRKRGEVPELILEK